MEPTFRPVVMKPKDFIFTLARYDDPSTSLLLTDLQFYRQSKSYLDSVSRSRNNNDPKNASVQVPTVSSSSSRRSKFQPNLKKKLTERPRITNKKGLRLNISPLSTQLHN